MEEKNLLVVHGGGPSPVLNASLFGVIEEARKNGFLHIYGAKGGCEGILKEEFWKLERLSGEDMDKLLATPGSVIGTSRFEMEEEDYKKISDILDKYKIQYVLFNGGNGTMDTCGRLHGICKNKGVRILGIPKTVDNDIAITDHTPGFGSAARFLAQTVREIGADVRSLPIHVCIIEAMGRNAGWLTAASVLARERAGDAPHLIYLPERPFREKEFLEDVEHIHKEKGGVLVVVREGIRDETGKPVVPLIYSSGRAEYFGDVGSYLAELVIRKLGIKARSEKPGILGRASTSTRSDTDIREAVLAGREAVKAALAGRSGEMIGLFRQDNPEGDYQIEMRPVPIKEVMLHEKKLPEEYINDRGNDVRREYVEWCRPLLGTELPQMLILENIKGDRNLI